jgi:hypothetical protein
MSGRVAASPDFVTPKIPPNSKRIELSVFAQSLHRLGLAIAAARQQRMMHGPRMPGLTQPPSIMSRRAVRFRDVRESNFTAARLDQHI